MNTKTNAKTASIREGNYGIPTPTIQVTFPKGTHYRAEKAALLRLAAAVEEATPAREGWCVRIDAERRRVELELGEATADEAQRGLAILRSVIAS